MKKELRKLYGEKRMALSASQRLKMDDLLLIQFQQSSIEIPEWVLSYQALEHHAEFDPYLIEEYCYFKNPGSQIVYPVIDETNFSMRCVLTDEEGHFQKNKYGIDEPVSGITIDPLELQLVILPLLCFDVSGQRVGYGKGYYDRLLKRCSESCVTVGFSYFPPIDALIDNDAFDVPLNYVITPENVHDFTL